MTRVFNLGMGSAIFLAALGCIGAPAERGPEVCNGLDDDGDDVVDNDPIDGDMWFEDADGDGFGDPETERRFCGEPDDDANRVQNGRDCDDIRVDIFPGAPERCNDVDEACDGVGADADADGDMWRICEGDCNDDDPNVFPGALERCNNLDDDCDGVAETPEAYLDDDNDGFRICDNDCDDEDPTVRPSIAVDVCDGRDEDCDGIADPDQDEWEPNNDLREAPRISGDNERVTITAAFSSPLDEADVFFVETVNDTEFLTNSFYMYAFIEDLPEGLEVELALWHNDELWAVDSDDSNGIGLYYEAFPIGSGGGGNFHVEVRLLGGERCNAPYRLVVDNGG
ncbi:MAG: putative metal-binding motif-containing protein [Myxococcota bacterium]